MEPNRIGRALGIGARVAGAKLREKADQLGAPATADEAAARLKAGAAQAARNFRAAQASASPGSGAAPAAPPAGPGARDVARGAARFGAALLRPFAHATNILWNQIAGIFFALFGLFFLEHAWMVYRATHGRDRHVYLYGGLALLFAWFAVSTFWRVRRRQRRG
jgi:hypothetical protein